MNREQMITHLTLMGWEPVWDRDTLAPWHGVGNRQSGSVYLRTTAGIKMTRIRGIYRECEPSTWGSLTVDELADALARIKEHDHAP